MGVLRELQEECGIDGASDPKLIAVAGKPDRDPRGHTVSIFYHVQVDPAHEVIAGDDAAAAEWHSLEEVMAGYEMAFDHREVLDVFMHKFRK